MSEQAPLDAASLRNALRPVQDWPDAGTLWDAGSGAAVFELTRPDALITPEVLRALAATEAIISQGFAGLIVTSNHPALFAFGAAGPFRHSIQTGDRSMWNTTGPLVTGLLCIRRTEVLVPRSEESTLRLARKICAITPAV